MIMDPREGERTRRVFAEDLATELDVDMDSKFMAASDKLLARLYMSGYVVVPIEALERRDCDAD